MSRMSYKSNTVSCKYCKQTGFYWQKTAKSWVLVKQGEGAHNCPMRTQDGKQIKQPITPYDFDDQGNRVYADIGYTPLPHAPAVGAYEENQAQKEYEDWAALQQHLKKILE